MYKAQFKTNTPYEGWSTIGSYGSEGPAISAAISKKRQGVLMVRVIDKSGSVIYSG